MRSPEEIMRGIKESEDAAAYLEGISDEEREAVEKYISITLESIKVFVDWAGVTSNEWRNFPTVIYKE